MNEDRKEMLHQFAVNLFCAWVANQQGIALSTAYKKYKDKEGLGDFWYSLAERIHFELSDYIDKLLEPPASTKSIQ